MFTGCGTALVTPFQNDFSLDEAALRRLVGRQVAAGVHFLVPCGTTGESPTLTEAERRRVVEVTLEEAHGKVPVVAGAGGYDTAEVVRVIGIRCGGNDPGYRRTVSVAILGTVAGEHIVTAGHQARQSRMR